jgi:hypothetical protein
MTIKRNFALSVLALLLMLAIPRAADASGTWRVELFNATDKCVWMTIDAGLVKRVNIRTGVVKPHSHLAFSGENESRMQVRSQFWPSETCGKGNFIQDRYDNFSGNRINKFNLVPSGNSFIMVPVG